MVKIRDVAKSGSGNPAIRLLCEIRLRLFFAGFVAGYSVIISASYIKTQGSGLFAVVYNKRCAYIIKLTIAEVTAESILYVSNSLPRKMFSVSDDLQ